MTSSEQTTRARRTEGGTPKVAYNEKSIYKQKAETPVIHSRGHCHPGRERGASGACAEASASIRGLTRFSVPCCVHRLERDRIRVSPPVASYALYFLLLLLHLLRSSFRVGFSSIYTRHSLGLLLGDVRDVSESHWRMVQCRLIEFCALHHLGRQLAVGFSTMNVPVYDNEKKNTKKWGWLRWRWARYSSMAGLTLSGQLRYSFRTSDVIGALTSPRGTCWLL